MRSSRYLASGLDSDSTAHAIATEASATKASVFAAFSDGTQDLLVGKGLETWTVGHLPPERMKIIDGLSDFFKIPRPVWHHASDRLARSGSLETGSRLRLH
jgi:hypothetical protein